MEEKVGELWHKLITRMADQRHHQAEVFLSDVRNPIGIFFRALGGDGGLRVEVVDATEMRRRRSWLQRIAGTGNKIELAWRDDNALKLPASIAWFEHSELNRDLYFWLAAMAANPVMISDKSRDNWVARNQLTTLWTLKNFPGLINRYSRLVKAHLQQRPAANRLPAAERQLELEIRQALIEPGSVHDLTPCRYSPFPVPLWLHPQNHLNKGTQSPAPQQDEQQRDENNQTRELDDIGRKKAEYVDPPEDGKGLITVRMENIFTWGEFINLDRGNEEEDDLDKAEAVARDLDSLAVNRDSKAASVRLKFDLDLPSQDADDEIVRKGFMLPEWDWKKQAMIDACCHIVEMTARDADSIPLPDHLRRTAKQLRNQFQMLAPARIWHSHQNDGQEVDLDAYLRLVTDRSAGMHASTDGLYRELNSGARDLGCLLVADLSLSTDTWINNQHRVIDVIRDSLFLFAESLHATGDPFSILGFSSRKRDPVRIHILKRFNETYNALVRGRINAIKPGYYTRLGAAIRYASIQLQQQPNNRRLLMILTDGKPNDLDMYEGRFGIEDTRQAIIEARQMGIQPYCVTIDQKGSQYLAHLFGTRGYSVIHNPLQMPSLLPRLYAQLTG